MTSQVQAAEGTSVVTLCDHFRSSIGAL